MRTGLCLTTTPQYARSVGLYSTIPNEWGTGMTSIVTIAVTGDTELCGTVPAALDGKVVNGPSLVLPQNVCPGPP